MSTRTIVLLALFLGLGVVYVWFFLLPSRGDLQLVVMQRPSRPVTFVFNRDVAFEELKVIKQEPGPGGAQDEGYERVVWHLLPDPEKADEREARDSVAYGRGVKGMRLAEGLSRRPEALKPGEPYTFEARTVAGDHVRQAFTPR